MSLPRRHGCRCPVCRWWTPAVAYPRKVRHRVILIALNWYVISFADGELAVGEPKRMDIHRCSTTRKTSSDTEKPGDSGHMSRYSEQPFGHPVLDPNTPSINQDTPDIVFGHSGRWPGDSGFGRYTFKKMFLSGFCGSQGFVQILWSTSSKSKTCRSKSLLIIRGFYTQI